MVFVKGFDLAYPFYDSQGLVMISRAYHTKKRMLVGNGYAKSMDTLSYMIPLLQKNGFY